MARSTTDKTSPPDGIVELPTPKAGAIEPVTGFVRAAPAAPPSVSVGVRRVSVSPISDAEVPDLITAYQAGESCPMFGRPGKGGGAGFAAWAAREGLAGRKTLEDWKPFLAEFAARPIPGHL